MGRITILLVVAVCVVPCATCTAKPLPKGFVRYKAIADAPAGLQEALADSEAARLTSIEDSGKQLASLKKDVDKIKNLRMGKDERARRTERLETAIAAQDARIARALNEPFDLAEYGGLGEKQGNDFLKPGKVVRLSSTFIETVVNDTSAIALIDEPYATAIVRKGVIVNDRKVRRTPVIIECPTKEFVAARSCDVDRVFLVCDPEKSDVAEKRFVLREVSRFIVKFE